MKIWITSIFVLVLSLASCHNGDQFLVKQPPPPASATGDLPPALPMPTAMPFPLPTAETSEEQCWKDHDLKVLQGCWKLGEDRHRTCFNGSTPFPCTLSALSVCFDDQGQSTTTHMFFDYEGVKHDCQPPMKAYFDADGHVVIEATQQVDCTNEFTDNVIDQYNCVYHSSGLANCVYHILDDPNHPDNGLLVDLKRSPTSQTVICKPKKHP